MTKSFALIGCPLGHSMSPFIHKKLFSISGVSADYQRLEILTESFKNSLPILKNYSGFNVTIPYKVEIIPFLKNMHPSARLYGAVNTVLVENGELTGYNTDADGFLYALKLKGVALSGRVLICGCGGVARTIAILSAGLGCDVTLGVRDIYSSKAANIKAEILSAFGKEIRLCPLKEINETFDIVINGTPLGMFPNTDCCPLTKEQLMGAKFIFDTVYNPSKTYLLRLAKELNIPAMGGMAMLIMQAAKAHEYWYGATFKKEALEELILETEKEMERQYNEK